MVDFETLPEIEACGIGLNSEASEVLDRMSEIAEQISSVSIEVEIPEQAKGLLNAYLLYSEAVTPFYSVHNALNGLVEDLREFGDKISEDEIAGFLKNIRPLPTYMEYIENDSAKKLDEEKIDLIRKYSNEDMIFRYDQLIGLFNELLVVDEYISVTLILQFFEPYITELMKPEDNPSDEVSTELVSEKASKELKAKLSKFDEYKVNFVQKRMRCAGEDLEKE